jgi:hypothetical protein
VDTVIFVALWNESIDVGKDTAIHALGMAMSGTTVRHSLRSRRIRWFFKSGRKSALCEMGEIQSGWHNWRCLERGDHASVLRRRKVGGRGLERVFIYAGLVRTCLAVSFHYSIWVSEKTLCMYSLPIRASKCLPVLSLCLDRLQQSVVTNQRVILYIALEYVGDISNCCLVLLRSMSLPGRVSLVHANSYHFTSPSICTCSAISILIPNFPSPRMIRS